VQVRSFEMVTAVLSFGTTVIHWWSARDGQWPLVMCPLQTILDPSRPNPKFQWPNSAQLNKKLPSLPDPNSTYINALSLYIFQETTSIHVCPQKVTTSQITKCLTLWPQHVT